MIAAVRLSRDRAITAGFVAFCFVLTLLQKPGWASADTKIDLHVDPSRFLTGVASVWSPTTDLGDVHSAQYSGYLWPMGPFFAALHALGIGAWVVQRLWLGLMLALAAWGMLRLLDVLVGKPRGIVHVVATAFVVLNPYTVVFAARTSITLLGYAALPWLLLITYHGVRETRGWRGWRGWWWAAGFALILTSAGGGINAAVVFWMLVGPLVLMLYEPAVGNVRWRDSGSFLARVGILGVLASLWWIVPLLVHVNYGIDFLRFTEQPSSIWATNSMTESLRLMGYWTSYIGVGFGHNRPFFSDGGTLLFSGFVVGSSLLLPAIAVGGFVWARRLRAAPLLLWLVVVGATVMTAGFPAGTPLRHGMEWVYHHIDVLRFLRTTNKAAPVAAVGLAGLLGFAAQFAWGRVRSMRAGPARRMALVAAPVALAALIAVAALPLVRGGALDSQVLFKRVPGAWRDAGRGLDRDLPANTRALVLPGQIFAFYDWGGTVDAILPRLTDRPVAVRYETPYSDLHANDLLATTDDLVQQRRLVPGQLRPLLRLMSAANVVTGADDDTSRSGAMAAAAAAGVLTGQGLGTPTHAYGPARPHPPAQGDVGGSVPLPEVREYDNPDVRGIVHVDPLASPTVVDGDASGLADAAAFGALPQTAAVFYAADESRTELRTQAAAGADVVVTDSNRRRSYLPQSTQQNHGPTLPATAAIDVNAASLDPFAHDGSDAQTVSVLEGARYLTAPAEPRQLQFPEHRPFAAFDGDPATTWVADGELDPSNRWIEIGLEHPMDVPYVDVWPLSDVHGRVTEVDINGVHAHVGGNTLKRVPVRLHNVSAIRVTIDHVVQPKVGNGGPGGFREIAIPGVHVRELLRAPVLAGGGLAGTDLSHSSLSYVFERTTGDDPFRRNPAPSSTLLDNPQLRGDPERYIGRVVFAPAARRYSVDAWVYPDVRASDFDLDRSTGAVPFLGPESSSRFQDQARYRASSAFDRDPATAWVGPWNGAGAWISWSTLKPVTVRRLRLGPPPPGVRRPTSVQLSATSHMIFKGWRPVPTPETRTPPMRVAPDGTVVLPQAVRGVFFKLDVLHASPGGAPAVGISELQAPGVFRARVPHSGPLHEACGSVKVKIGGKVLPLRVDDTIAHLDAGLPLRAHGCGKVAMGAGVQHISSLPGSYSVDLLRLRSPAPAPIARATAPGAVTNPGSIGTHSVDGVSVSLGAPSWLVLGESYSKGWRATCDGRSLGEPRVIDAYANGWRAPAGCKRVAFSFQPQDGVDRAYVISGAICALLVLFLLWGAWRRRRRATEPVSEPGSVAQRGARPVALPWAVGAAAAFAVPLGAIFAIRAGAAIFLILAFVLWRGFTAKTLTLIAIGILGVVVPLTYVIKAPPNRGGFDFVYSVDLIDAHWLAVAAIVLLGVAAARAAGDQRSTKAKSTPRAE